MSKENNNNRKKAVGWVNPDRMDVEKYLRVGDGEYNGDFVITGVNTRTDGSLVYTSMDDLVAYPYSHGLMTAIEAISQIYSHVECSKVHDENSEFPPLKIRFEANITDAFSGGHNPTAWIHIGHGMLENDILLLEDLEDDEEYESVPGISNGHEEKDFLCARYVRDLLRSKEGHVLFASLPICYGKQIGEILCESEVIQMMFAPIDFAIPSGLEFFDNNPKTARPQQTLTAWARWVQNSENLIGPSTIRRIKTGGVSR
jgi:hypothetical protein